MYVVYIIYSGTLDRYYIGYTSDIETRLTQHNSGVSEFTSKAKDWTLKHIETYDTREEAMTRERTIKQKKSRNYIEWLVNSKA